MKKYAIALLLCLSATWLGAQTGKKYASFSYIRLQPGKAEAYYKLITTYSPVITAARIRLGGVQGWYIFRVVVPASAQVGYDMVSITITDEYKLQYDDLAPSDEVIRKILPGASQQEVDAFFKEWESTRVTVKREIYELAGELPMEFQKGQYAMADFIQVSNEKRGAVLTDDRLKVTPAYSTLAKNGVILGRQLWSSILPVEASPLISICYTNDINKWSVNPADQLSIKSETKIATGAVTHRELLQLVEFVNQQTAGSR